MKLGTSTASLIPETAKLISSEETFNGFDPAKNEVRIKVEEKFDVDGDGSAEIVRGRVYAGSLDEDLYDINYVPKQDKLVRDEFSITDRATGERTYAWDTTGSGKISSVLTMGGTAQTLMGEKDLNGDDLADKRVERENGKIKISTSTQNNGVFDVIEYPNGGFGW